MPIALTTETKKLRALKRRKKQQMLAEKGRLLALENNSKTPGLDPSYQKAKVVAKKRVKSIASKGVSGKLTPSLLSFPSSTEAIASNYPGNKPLSSVEAAALGLSNPIGRYHSILDQDKFTKAKAGGNALHKQDAWIPYGCTREELRQIVAIYIHEGKLRPHEVATSLLPDHIRYPQDEEAESHG